VADDLRRVVKSPDGLRYEVVGLAKDWRLGTGSMLLDAAAFVWAAVRQARGKEWVVSVRRVDSGNRSAHKASGEDRERCGLDRLGIG
jgi:hypothetical protein